MILVTGATGCIGANLTRALLAAGERVAALRLPHDASRALADVEGDIVWRTGDLLDPNALRSALSGITHVYHAAGVALPYEADRARMMDVNVRGTENLLRAAHEANVRRVVYVSSIAAIGYPDGRCDESFEYNGDRIRFAYMHTKRAAEDVAQRFAAQGLDVVSVCPTAVIAPYCDRAHGWGRVMLDVQQGRMPFCPPGGIAVIGRKDLVHALQLAMARGRSGERYIVNGENVSYRALPDTFANAMGVAPPRHRVPRWAIRGAAAMARVAAPLVEAVIPRPRMSAGVLELLWRNKHYSCEKAERELGYAARHSLAEASAETWSWLKRAEG